MLSLLFLTAGIFLSSCKKDESPELGGPSTQISGNWQMDVSNVYLAAGTIPPRFTFGTNYRYEYLSGKVTEPVVQKGTYTVSAGAASTFLIKLKPGNGQEHTLEVTGADDRGATFEVFSAPPMRYLRQ